MREGRYAVRRVANVVERCFCSGYSSVRGVNAGPTIHSRK